MPQTQRPVGVIGVGYVGLVTAVCVAHLGHQVVCLDVDEAKIAALRDGRVPIYEPGLEDLLAGARARLSFTTSYDELCARARVLFIAVDTPPSPSGDADLSRVESVVREIVAHDGERLLVMKSTVPVGTGEHVVAELQAAGASSIGYVSNPEFLREGAAVDDVLHPDRIVIGSYRDTDGDEIEALFADIETTVVRTSVATAEMIKYASNAFLATKISFINEIANVCEAVGADVRTVADGMGLDHRIGPHFLQAGIGYGGSCFPKDVQALKQLAGNSGYHFQLLNAVIEVNHLQKRRVIGKLKECVGPLRGRARHAARPHLQAAHRRPARGRLDRSRRTPARRGRARLGVRPHGAARLARRPVPRRRDRGERARRPRRRRRGCARHRVARDRRARLGHGR